MNLDGIKRTIGLGAILLSLAIIFALPLNSFGKDKKCIEGDCENGRGTFEYEVGSIYDGDWKGGKEHGQGVMTSLEGTYEGSFKNGLPNGKGVFSLRDGRKYTGDWKDGVAHGQGLEVYRDGSSYEGSWRNGLPNGYGVSTSGGAEDKVGYWIDGEYVGHERPWNID